MKWFQMKYVLVLCICLLMDSTSVFADTYTYDIRTALVPDLQWKYTCLLNIAPSSSTYTIVDTKKVIITNTSGDTITLSSSSPFNMSYASAPALKHRFLSPGQNVDVTNSSGGTESITVDGVHDYARYDAQGDLSTFAKGSARGSKSILSMNRIAITNRDTTTIDVYEPTVFGHLRIGLTQRFFTNHYHQVKAWKP